MNLHISPSLQIGKNGLTKEVEEEIKKRLKKNKELKIRLLKSAGEREKIFEKLKKELDQSFKRKILIRLIGRVIVINLK